MEASDLIAAAVDRLREHYIFPERVPAMATVLAKRLAGGEYDRLAGVQLCAAVTRDLHAANPDLHLGLTWSDDVAAVVDWSEPAVLTEFWQESRLDNHGVYRVERLSGNVGYLDLRNINDAAETGATLAAAMALLANTGALLLDLRHNSGGAPTGVAMLCSYFVGPAPVRLSDEHSRASGVQQFWTYPVLPGVRYTAHVWVLTSRDTFSAGEQIAYDLQQLKRVTLVGETTRGAAHPSREYALDEHYRIRIPVARSVSPISGTNWEGVGVQPDVPVNAAGAYDVAYAAALRAVLDAFGDDPPSHARATHAEATSALAVLRPDRA